MGRLKRLATATLMALTVTACDEGTPPPVEPPPPPTPVGTISGTVTIEGTAASGITATLSSGATTTTGSGGSFAFSGVEAGTYTVTISGFPEDATFAQVTQPATIATDGQNVQLNFAGEYVRTSSVVGNVVAADAVMSGGDGQPETLIGVTVTLGGEHATGEMMETGMDGGFAFTGLRAGAYTVTISDFPEDVSFESVSMEVEVGVGEVGNANFTGHFIRTSAVEGHVVIEGEGLAGVTVTLSGGPADEMYTMMTDADGMYRFEELRPGDYTVAISDFDTRDYEFAATSADVSVDLDETGTVSFTGVLLRTSGIAGRVSVEGMGLGGIEVSLAGGDSTRTTMTDDGGQYSFAGLAAGDYTVSIAVESDAYVFESMSADLALGDDQSAIVNFEGAHARTASVSGMAFIDEATRNDMFDEGEHPLAHAGIPVALVGPGVNEQRLGATDATGAFSFTGLRAGHYQLVVLLDATVAATLAANDLAYGGPGTGYEIEVGVGEAASQSIPFDITHTTVNFTVSLRHGDETGDAVPGARVSLHADAAGETEVGHGDTGEDGSAAIKVARAATSGNTVYASVSAEGYEGGEGLTAVSWDPQMFATAGTNENDLVNLHVNASFSGATVTTGYGGDDALAGWAISVTHGDDAVESAPEMLDDDGNAAFKTTVGADDLPATFTIALADDQADKLDGGETFDGGSVEYTHTGLKLAGTQDAGTLEVQFTTQTLKVYVHHERDQVMGYTGNVLQGDERDDGRIHVEIRYVDDSGRSRAFQSSDSIGISSDKGAWTFSHVPADMNVIVQAEDGQDADDEDYVPIILLDEGGHSDELAAYTGTDVNGITGGHFGAHGGYSHTVSLCPLQATSPQDHGECSSFAYVSAYGVSGTVTKRTIAMDDGDNFEAVKANGTEEGITVGLTPVDGENLAGEEQSATTAEKDDDDTEALDETFQFDFGNIAAGVYAVGVSDGWEANGGDADGLFDPLGGGVTLNVTPSTATVYGFVVDEDGFAMDSATVTANAESAVTDEHGRFIIGGIESETRTIDGRNVTGIFVEASVEDAGNTGMTLAFEANTVKQVRDEDGNDLQLTAATETATIGGTVTASGSGDGISGVKVEVSYDGETFEAPENVNAKEPRGAPRNNVYVTGADGSYSITVKARARGDGVRIRVSRDGMSFVPDVIADIPAHAGSDVSGLNFTGFLHATITGRVVAAGGGPMSGVTVTATGAGAPEGAEATDSVVTGRTGIFSLSVPYGGYTVTATAPEGSLTRFSYPDDRQDVSVAPGRSVNFGSIRGASVAARIIDVERMKDDDGNYVENHIKVTLAWDTVAGFSEIDRYAQTSSNDGEDWSPGVDLRVLDEDEYRFSARDYRAFHIRIRTEAEETVGGTTTRYIEDSAVTAVDAVDASPNDATAERGVGEGADEGDDLLTVTWKASSNRDTHQRILIEVEVAEGRSEWLIAEGGDPTALAQDTRKWVLNVTDIQDPSSWSLPDGTGTRNVTPAALLKALKVQVQTRLVPRFRDPHEWVASNTVEVDAKPDDG